MITNKTEDTANIFNCPTIHNVKMDRNPKFGKWTEEETNWSAKDTKFLKYTNENSSGSESTSLKQLKELHESLPY